LTSPLDISSRYLLHILSVMAQVDFTAIKGEGHSMKSSRATRSKEEANLHLDAISDLSLFLPSFPIIVVTPEHRKHEVQSALDKVQDAVNAYISIKRKKRSGRDGSEGRAADWLDIEGESYDKLY
jgi:hypothetical protein